MSKKVEILKEDFRIQSENRLISISESPRGIGIYLFTWGHGVEQSYFLDSEKNFNELWETIKKLGEKQKNE